MLRKAHSGDLPAIVVLLVDDPLGAAREIAAERTDCGAARCDPVLRKAWFRPEP